MLPTMKHLLTSILAVLVINLLPVQAQEAFAWYTGSGKQLDFDQVIKRAGKADVVLFGELHNNALCHWLQLELLTALEANKTKLILGAEMLEADDQTILNEYQQGLISSKLFEREARLWPNYDTDYKPLVDFAVEHNIPVVATNVPRRYASVVAKEGQKALTKFDETAKGWMAPLPYPFSLETPGYQEMLDMMGSHGAGGENMVQAQALKDATMAHFIAENWTKGSVFYHLQGDYHSANEGGIGAYLKEYAKRRKVLVISTVEGESLAWDNSYEKRGDIVLITKQNFTKTH